MAIVLARRPGESIIITDKVTGERIEVCVNRIKGKEVRLAFICPRERWDVQRPERIANWSPLTPRQPNDSDKDSQR